jgi:hypothetical protein
LVGLIAFVARRPTVKRLAFVSALMCISLLPGAGAFAQQEPENPLVDIVTDMSVVVRDLSKLRTGKPTQETQQQVVTKLDELIKRLEQQCADCRGGASGANPTRPLADSVIMGGPGGVGDLHAPSKGGKNWGELPPHQRDRILQSQTEGFPPHYQKILERYYKRLAEERPAAESQPTNGAEQ